MFITKDKARKVFIKLLANVCRHYDKNYMIILAPHFNEKRIYLMKKAILIYLCSKHGIRPSDIVEFIKDYGFDYSVAFYQRHIELFKITYERYPKLRVLIDQLMVVNIDDEEQVEKEQKSFKW